MSYTVPMHTSPPLRAPLALVLLTACGPDIDPTPSDDTSTVLAGRDLDEFIADKMADSIVFTIIYQ